MGIETALLISAGVAAATSAAGAIIGGSQKQEQMNQQARMYERQAQQTQQAAALQKADIQRRANRAVGRQAALAGAGGVDIQGSIVDQLAQTRADAARDLWSVQWNADNRSNNLYESASNTYAMGQQEMTNAYVGAGFKALNLLGGAALTSFSGPSTSTFGAGATNFTPNLGSTGMSRQAGYGTT